MYYHGEQVVDLWGGTRNQATGEPWQEDTMVLVFSATKGFAAMTMALLHSRGLLDYEERVCTYWPEFAQNGKQKLTVRRLLAHQAGLLAFDERVDRSVIADLDRLAMVMARQKPAWEPGTRQAYHAITLGFYEGELVRRVDPQHRTLGQVLPGRDRRATRCGRLHPCPRRAPQLQTGDAPAREPDRDDVRDAVPHGAGLDESAVPLFRALIKRNPGSTVAIDEARFVARNLEVPSGGGVGSARGIACTYNAFATGGREVGLRPETLQALLAPAVPPAHGFRDEALKGEYRFSFGFLKPSSQMPFGRPGAFGSPGSGGSFGFADPERGIAYAYVMNRIGASVTVDAREIALREALASVIR